MRSGLWLPVLGSLLGNYRVVHQLSEGGMGVVYVAHHEALGRRVVIKVLQPELCNDADMVQRFFHEARAATAIRSPGIVQVFDFGVTPDRRAYFVMELLEGESLAVRLKRRRCDFAECCRLGRQIANVLQAAHAAGITHRDLKPANLFLVPDPEVAGGERVKVLDFGIAKLAGEARSAGVQTTRTGLMMGTPSYMSPEQCRSASTADARSDIYSLGCILFQIACGRPPFLFTGIGDIIAAHLHERPPHPHQLAPGVPPGLSALIAQMLAKHPDARPQTMAAVGQALDDLLRTADPAAAQLLTPLIGVGPSPSPIAPPSPPVAPAAASSARPASAPPVPLEFAQPGPMAIAQPVRLPRPPVPGFSSIATTLRHLTGAFAVRRRDRVRRLTYVLGALVIAGAVTAIAIVSSSNRSGPQEPRVPYAKIAASRAKVAPAAAPTAEIADAAVTGAAARETTSGRATDAAGASSVVPAGPANTTDAATGTAATGTAAAVGSVVAECRRHEADRNWQALAQCAGKLRPLDVRLAAELSTRAAEETRSAPHVAAARAALRDGALKQAKAEIDQVWPNSVDCTDLQRSYAAAETQEINALATQLDSVKDASCAAYNQLLAKYRTSDPPRVAQEAARRVSCKAAPKCDADALEAQGRALFNKNKLEDALDAYDAAYSCRPAMTLLQAAFVVACNMRVKAEARSYWRQLSPALRAQSLGVCVSNGISEKVLNIR